MGELSRETDVVGHHRSNAFFKQPCVGRRRQNHPKPAAGQQRAPERKVLIHVQHARDSKGRDRRPLRFHRPVEEEVQSGGEKIFSGANTAAAVDKTALATVPGKIIPPLAEADPGDLAAVLAAGTVKGPFFCIACRRGPVETGESRFRGRFGKVILQRRQGRAIGPHHFGDVRPDDLFSDQQLECAQNGGVSKGPALDDDSLSEGIRILQLQDLVEGVPDHRKGEPRRYLPDSGPLAEGLSHAGIHENRATRSQIERLRRLAGDPGEFRDPDAERGGKGFDEGAATRGAGLVDLDIGDATVADGDRLHVLAADVEDKGDIRSEETGRAIVGHRFHDTVINGESGPDEVLAVPRHGGSNNMGRRVGLATGFPQRIQSLLHRRQGVAVIRRVPREGHTVVAVHQQNLGRR